MQLLSKLYNTVTYLPLAMIHSVTTHVTVVNSQLWTGLK
jgi:hypothetical protein